MNVRGIQALILIPEHLPHITLAQVFDALNDYNIFVFPMCGFGPCSPFSGSQSRQDYTRFELSRLSIEMPQPKRFDFTNGWRLPRKFFTLRPWPDRNLGFGDISESTIPARRRRPQA